MLFDKALAKLKENGVANGEEILVDSYKAVQAAVAETAVEGKDTEKLIATLLIPILAGFAPQIAALADLNKDGKVGN